MLSQGVIKMWQTDATLPKERMLDGWFQQQRSHFFLIATLSFTLLFTGLHRGDLSGYDDAAYAHEAKQILKSGDWWTLRLNGYPDFDKPPMFVWILAVSMKIFGITDFAAKFPSALAGFLTIVLVFFLTRELTDDFWIPILAMFVMATTQYFLKYAMHAMTCVPFSFFFTLAIFTYVKALDRPPYFLAFGLSAGIASLIRSPMGYFPLAIIVLHLIFIRRYSLFRSGYFIGCVILSVALPLSWYAVMHYRDRKSVV